MQCAQKWCRNDAGMMGLVCRIMRWELVLVLQSAMMRLPCDFHIYMCPSAKLAFLIFPVDLFHAKKHTICRACGFHPLRLFLFFFPAQLTMCLSHIHVLIFGGSWFVRWVSYGVCIRPGQWKIIDDNSDLIVECWRLLKRNTCFHGLNSRCLCRIVSRSVMTADRPRVWLSEVCLWPKFVPCLLLQ